MYATKAQLSKIFGVSPPTVYDRVRGIEKEIGKRYNRYAILDKLVCAEVYADYEKYHRRLADKNLRKTVEPFNMQEAKTYMEEKREGVQRDKIQKAQV
ncbi:hypothetical protein DWW31_05155 [Clostridium sp. AF15-17LB]|nr:hypothetical protein DWW31_05155 [Clostridium sp. AF15-17LB]